MYSIPGELIRSFFDASPFILSALRTLLLNFQISLYILLLNIIMLIPVSLCVVSTIPFNSSASLRIYFLVSLKYLQLLSFPVAAYLPFWPRSLSTFLSYPTSRFQASSSLKKTAHSRPLWHIIMSLGQLFWAAFPALGLSRLHGDTSPSAVAKQARQFSPSGPTHLNNPLYKV